MIRHHFTVDVEEYFQVRALERHAPFETWEKFPSRVERSTDLLLELLDEASAPGTFFILGWIAQRHPALVRRIAAAGHEIASHGWRHRPIPVLSPDEFRESVRRSKRVLEDVSGVAVQGYRAPNFSVVAGLEWAFDVLLEEGYSYDSSRLPVRRRGSGDASAPREPHWVERAGGRLREYPPATLRAAGRNWAAGGGAYFRLFPYALVRAGLRDAAARGHGGTFYIHPWELDPEQPRMDVRLPTRIRHYGNLSRTVPRLRRLLAEFAFERMDEAAGRVAGPAAARTDESTATRGAGSTDAAVAP